MDEPSPTIVGPQSKDPSRRVRPDVPRGIERVVALASASETLREQVLQDPLAAADKAGLKLTDTERSVLKSVSRPSLEAMIKVAGAALLAAGLAGCDQLRSVSMGIQPDEPEPKTQPEDSFERVAPGGILADEPPEAQPEKIRTMLRPATTGQIQDFSDTHAGPAPGGPIEEEPTRGIRGDVP